MGYDSENGQDSARVRRYLHALVSRLKFIHITPSQKYQRAEVLITVTDEHFIEKLEKILAILRPLDCLIVKYQSDKIPI